MLILAKTAMVTMLGFILAILFGIVILSILRKKNINQTVSTDIHKRHQEKNGTPTMGGLIFIIPVLFTLLLLLWKGSISWNYNLGILLFVFVSYAILGFVDDYIKVYRKHNRGLSTMTKLVFQMMIALVFFFLYLKGGGTSVLTLSFLNISFNLEWLFGIFIFLLLVGTTNAVNVTDGLDGLAGGLSLIAFFAYGIIAWNCGWLVGYEEIAIFSFALIGALMGFLIFNSYPARVFMGDLGSLALGGALATIAIITKHEFSLILIGGIFFIEVVSSLVQIVSIRAFNRKIFLKAPLHHHFEELNWKEQDIVKLFWVIGLIFAMAAITYGVWL